MSKNLVALCLFINCSFSFAQDTAFRFSGTVEYEKIVNMHAIIRKIAANSASDIIMQTLLDRYKTTQPQFRRYKGVLSFDKNTSLFKPKASDDNKADPFYSVSEIANQPNIVFTDLTIKKRITQKTIFDKRFLLTDTIKKIRWKLTTETRQICGFTCRRINGIILDSIYVVAFYTERIPIGSGPESFSGAPGLILQVTLPHENVTWVATTVTLVPVSASELLPPNTGEVINRSDLKRKISATIKNTSYFPIYLKMFSM